MPDLHWQRFETHRSPKGHGMRARARGKTIEAWQDASGRWWVRSTDRPQTKRDFKTWPEARSWAAERASANPGAPARSQVVHSRPGLQKKPPMAKRKSGRTTNPGDKHMACGDLSAKDCRQLQHVYESARGRGFSKKRAAQQAWGSLRNPDDVGSRRVVLFDEDGYVEWRGTLGEFFDANDVSEKRVIRHLEDEGEVHFGGGSAPLYTLAWDESAKNHGRGRKRNGARGRKKNGAGLGAFLGSLIGSALGMGVASAPLAVIGSIGGGAIGGHLGAPKDRRRRGSIGGAAGGALLGPIGAAVGGYIGGREPDKQRNPKRKARARRR